MENLNSLIPADSLWHLAFATDINDADKVVGSGGTAVRSMPFSTVTDR
ncbi:MAG TPA: hypothetical protein VI055_03135 [Rubrobacter sp.]|jgi:hypothetical protein